MIKVNINTKYYFNGVVRSLENLEKYSTDITSDLGFKIYVNGIMTSLDYFRTVEGTYSFDFRTLKIGDVIEIASLTLSVDGTFQNNELGADKYALYLAMMRNRIGLRYNLNPVSSIIDSAEDYFRIFFSELKDEDYNNLFSIFRFVFGLPLKGNANLLDLSNDILSYFSMLNIDKFNDLEGTGQLMSLSKKKYKMIYFGMIRNPYVLTQTLYVTEKGDFLKASLDNIPLFDGHKMAEGDNLIQVFISMDPGPGMAFRADLGIDTIFKDSFNCLSLDDSELSFYGRRNIVYPADLLGKRFIAKETPNFIVDSKIEITEGGHTSPEDFYISRGPFDSALNKSIDDIFDLACFFVSDLSKIGEGEKEDIFDITGESLKFDINKSRDFAYLVMKVTSQLNDMELIERAPSLLDTIISSIKGNYPGSWDLLYVLEGDKSYIRKFVSNDVENNVARKFYRDHNGLFEFNGDVTPMAIKDISHLECVETVQDINDADVKARYGINVGDKPALYFISPNKLDLKAPKSFEFHISSILEGRAFVKRGFIDRRDRAELRDYFSFAAFFENKDLFYPKKIITSKRGKGDILDLFYGGNDLLIKFNSQYLIDTATFYPEGAPNKTYNFLKRRSTMPNIGIMDLVDDTYVFDDVRKGVGNWTLKGVIGYREK